MKALVVLLLAGALACGRSEGPRPTRLALNWFPEAEHGGYFAAVVHGLYAARGRTLELVPGGPGVPVVPRVASREVAFGVANADDVVAARAAGVPVVALLAPIHQSPWCVMVHAESGIERIADLHDLTLAMRAGTPYLGWIEHSISLGERRIQIVPYGGSVAPFLADPRYAQQAYVFSEPIIARSKGADVRCLPIADTGFDPYASVLVTSAALAAADPALVRDVTRASARGWARYAEEPGPTNVHILALNPELGQEVLDRGAEALRPLVLDDAARRHGVGSMSAERWATLVRQMHELDASEGPSAPPRELDPTALYDTHFLGVTD